jgi:hypothetical protein
MKSKYKYQVVVHIPYYPSSVLFETEEGAWGYYNSIKDADHEDSSFITVCEILGSRGDDSQYDSEIEWYLEKEVK